MRRPILLGAIILGLLLSLLVAWLAGHRNRINLEGFEAIRPGMSEQEVEALLRSPAGDHTTGPVLEPSEPDEFDAIAGKRWLADEDAIYVNFDAEGKVAGAHHRAVIPTERGLLDRLRRLFR